jgi:hypothetical protein
MNRLLLLFLILPCFPKAQNYTEISQSIGINHAHKDLNRMGGGCAFFDYNNDGYEDLYLSGGQNRDYLYQNNGNGTFTELGIAAGLASTGTYQTFGIITGDIDNDGDRDLFLTTFMDTDSLGNDYFVNNKLFVNQGNGTFVDESTSAGITDSSMSISATFGDFNKDGFLDIYVGNYLDYDGPIQDSLGNLTGIQAQGFANYYYINNGNRTFTQSANSSNTMNMGCALAVTATDYDNDNDVDIYMANDFGEWNAPNALYQNNHPNPIFTDVSASSNANIGLFGMGIAVGDYNEDLHLDYYVTNLGENVLLHNNGNGTFTDTATFAGLVNGFVDTLLSTGWGCAFFDYNNDSYLDLFVANGQIPMPATFRATHPEDPNKLYHNNGDGTFTDTSNYLGLSSRTIAHGMAYADYDNDGDIDFVTAVIDRAIPSDSMPHTLFYQNDAIGNTYNWVQVKLEGTLSNRDAFGAHVLVYAAGRTFLREVSGGSSHASQNSSIQHIGLQNINQIDSIVVQWPNTAAQTFYHLNINQRHTFIEGQFNALSTLEDENQLEVYPNPTSQLLHIHFKQAVQHPFDITLCNALGNVVYEKKNCSQHKITISLEALNLSLGIYSLKINQLKAKNILFKGR